MVYLYSSEIVQVNKLNLSSNNPVNLGIVIKSNELLVIKDTIVKQIIK